jgi:hypothetical protein
MQTRTLTDTEKTSIETLGTDSDLNEMRELSRLDGILKNTKYFLNQSNSASAFSQYQSKLKKYDEDIVYYNEQYDSATRRAEQLEKEQKSFFDKTIQLKKEIQQGRLNPFRNLNKELEVATDNLNKKTEELNRARADQDYHQKHINSLIENPPESPSKAASKLQKEVSQLEEAISQITEKLIERAGKLLSCG